MQPIQVTKWREAEQHAQAVFRWTACKGSHDLILRLQISLTQVLGMGEVAVLDGGLWLVVGDLLFWWLVGSCLLFVVYCL